MKSDDYIAPKILPAGLIPFIKIKFFRELFIKILIPKGLYEYVIVRTKCFDKIFEDAIADDFEQILVMGAGFDSRGLRMVKDNSKVTVFELDLPVTQHNKLKQLKNRHIEISKHIKYIPINFITDSLENKLLEYDFDFQKKTLFMMEGLIMYLNFNSKEALRFGIELKNTKKVIGVCCIWQFDDTNNKCMIYFQINRKEWNKGYATESIAKLIWYAFEELKINQIEAYVTLGNECSIKVLLKNGFVNEGLM